MPARVRSSAATPGRILDVAEKLVQTGGYNGFSYADIAEAVGITKASLHYHFPTKAVLGERLIERYHQAFFAALADIDSSSPDAGEQLRGYAALYASVLRKNRMCLCGMLAAEYATLPRGMKERLRRFFDENERWLQRVLDEGARQKTLSVRGSSQDAARLLVASLEGAMLLARACGEPDRFDAAAERLLADLGAARRD